MKCRRISRTCVFKNTWTYTESTSHHSPSSPSSLSSASSLLLLLKRSACRMRLRCCCSTQILDTQAQKHATWVKKIPLMRSNRALWTLIKDNASYELTRACGKLCRIPCLKSTFAASKCLFCGLQSTTNSGLQSTEHGDDLHQDRGRLTRGSGLLPLASHLDRWLAMHTCIGYKTPKLLVGSSVSPKYH